MVVELLGDSLDRCILLAGGGRFIQDIAEGSLQIGGPQAEDAANDFGDLGTNQAQDDVDKCQTNRNFEDAGIEHGWLPPGPAQCGVNVSIDSDDDIIADFRCVRSAC